MTVLLESLNLNVQLTLTPSLADGLQVLKHHAFDLILLNLALPDSTGIASLTAVATVAPHVPIIVLQATSDAPCELEALQAGAQDCWCKDALNARELRRSILYAIERSKRLTQVETKMQAATHQAEHLRQILDSNTDAMLLMTQAHEIKWLNPAARQLLEASPGSLAGETFPFEVKCGACIELEIPGANNDTHLVELNAIDLAWEENDAILVILRDVTHNRAVKRALIREKERLAMILDSVVDAVIATNAKGEIELINQEAAELIGLSVDDATGCPLGEVLKLRHPKTGKLIADPIPIFLSAERAEIKPELGICLCRTDDHEVLVTAEMRCMRDQCSGHHGCVVVLRDITAQKKMEEASFQSEKLHSIKLLAGGIAHDFNNMLTAILGNISMVRMNMGAGTPNADKLLSAEKAALQATSLTQQLLTFTKEGTPLLEVQMIDQLIEDCVQFSLRGSNVKYEIDKEDPLWTVDVNAGQITQVINNLIINADQAMPDGGVIRLSLTCERIRAGQIPSLAAGDYLCIRIQDQGVGITPENLKRIFDPYFTTKQNGNGLGLASSYSIIKNHDGIIVVDSIVAQGSTFKIYLPRAAKALPPTAADTEDDNTIHQGNGRILVMDDMEAMMLVAGEILQVLGYEVEFSSNGDEAIEMYKQARESGNPFDAVVFDLTVPGGMGGEEACRILSQYDPNLIAIASSGYSTSNVMSDFEPAGFKAVVPKPYRIKDMSAVLHRILK